MKFFLYLCCPKKRSRGRVARQRSAKPCTAVRIRSRPQDRQMFGIINSKHFLFQDVTILKGRGVL